MLKLFWAFLGILFLAVGGTSFYLYNAATRLPNNRPHAFLNKKAGANQKVVVCIGDSLTHGRVSYNYVDALDRRFPADYLFVNAGINSQLAYNVLQRIDDIIALKPDYITILIGTCDVLGTLGEKSALRYIKKWNLPQVPDRKWFRKNLTQIVTRLQAETRAEIALLSLPPVTEDVEHPGYIQARAYSVVIKEVAQGRKLAYLPLNEIVTFAVEGETRANAPVFKGPERTLLYKAIVSHYLLGRSWDSIAVKNNFFFLTDFIHLNAKGAGIAADLIDAFIRHH